MDIIYLLIPLAIIIIAVGLWAFFWAVDSGQFEDLESPAHSILYDDDEALIPEEARPDAASTRSHSKSKDADTDADR